MVARTGRCSEGVRAGGGIVVLVGGTRMPVVVRGMDGVGGGVAGKGVRIVGAVEWAGGWQEGGWEGEGEGEGEGDGEEGWYDIH